MYLISEVYLSDHQGAKTMWRVHTPFASQLSAILKQCELYNQKYFHLCAQGGEIQLPLLILGRPGSRVSTVSGWPLRGCVRACPATMRWSVDSLLIFPTADVKAIACIYPEPTQSLIPLDFVHAKSARRIPLNLKPRTSLPTEAKDADIQ